MGKPVVKEELIKKIAALGPISDEQRNSVVCALIGHSKIVTRCCGFIYCARCDALIGDRLAGSFSLTGFVIVGHGCPECHQSYDNLTWKDKIFAPSHDVVFGKAGA